MNKLYIIILEDSVDSDFIYRRIYELGVCYRLYKNKFLFYSDEYKSAKSLYNRIITEDFKQKGIVVIEIPLNGVSYWGYSDKGLWSWLKNIIPFNNDEE